MTSRPDIARLAATLDEPLVLVDVGVRWGFEPRWEALAGAARLIGFDADEDECDVLRGRHPGGTFVAAALSDTTGTATLHVAEEPASSSLLEPDAELIARRRAWRRCARPGGPRSRRRRSRRGPALPASRASTA